MSTKAFPKHFEDFTGVDLRSSDLTRPGNFARKALNCRFSLSKSLRKRDGYQCVAQAGGFLGGHTYRYLDSSTGATEEELLAINDNLWRLVETSFTITRGASATWDWDVSVSGGQYVFTLSEGSTVVFSQNLGTGLEEIPYSIAELRDAIDALANYSCSTIGLRAKVNGDQTGVSSITVDNGSGNYAAGDILTFWDYSTSKLVARTVTSVTATTVVFSSSEGTVNVKDNQFLGVAAVPAASIAVNEDNEATGTTSTVYFNYWDWVPFDYIDPLYQSRHPFAEMWADNGDADFTPPSFANVENICLIATYTSDDSTFDGDAPGRLFKYDGHSVYRAGLPTPQIAEFTAPAASGTGSLTGTYRLKARYKHTDKRGRVTYGNTSDEFSITASSDEMLAAYFTSLPFAVPKEHRAIVDGNQVGVTTIQVEAPHLFGIGDTVWLYNVTTLVSRSITAVTDNDITISGGTVTVDDGQFIVRKTNERFSATSFPFDQITPASNTISGLSAHGFRVGDNICIPLQPSASLFAGVFQSELRQVTAVTSSSITFNGSTIEALGSGNYVCSKGLEIQLFRTKAGGNVFYLAKELPAGPVMFEGQIVFTAVPDDLLGEELNEPPVGFEWDLPPKARHLTIHQGIPVAAGDINAPNNVYWPDVENIEGWPLASSVATVNSAVSGPVSAIASDSDDALIVGKSNALYSFQGDLVSGSFSVKNIAEGDHGLYHSSIAKVDGILVGVGPLGIVAIKNSELIKPIGWKVSPRIINKLASIRLQLAQGVNDSGSRGYQLYIPDGDIFVVDDAVSFFLDYDRQDTEPVWFDDTYPIGIEPSRGMMMYENTLHFISFASGGSSYAALSGHLFRQTKLKTAVSKNYWDNHLAIDQDLHMAFESMDEPSIDKEYLWLALYSLYNSEETNLFVANTAEVSTYRNFQTSTADTSYSTTFAAVTEFEKRQKLNSTKARSLMVRVRNNTGGASFHLTGLELVIALSYLKEEMHK